MNEEELFCKLFPEYVVNGKPLSPYFDLFESGYEQAENRFEELKKQLDYKEKALAKAKKEVQRVADRVNKDKRRLIRRKHEYTDQLTKAKEIIKLLLWDLRNRSYEPIKDVERAEQFLNDFKQEG